MKLAGGTDRQKRRAGESAAEEVEDGMTVGLGTGSTAAYAIRAIGGQIESMRDVRGVPTSFQSRKLAREVGIPLVGLDEVERIDIAIDGADQFAGPNLVKGGGAAHAHEKIVDSTAERFIVVADPSKETETLDHSIPVEVLPDAWTVVARRVQDAFGDPTLRDAERKDGPVVTDNGNLVLDCDFGEMAEPGELAATLSELPGVVEHGLFVGLADEIHVGTDDGVEIRKP